jgi:ABC-type phosphate/phosphonate transport system substrate-binding protein
VVLSKELKDPLRARVVQAITKLSQPEHRDMMRSFISSLFVGFKPTTTAEHLGPLTHYLKLARLKYMERL